MPTMFRLALAAFATLLVTVAPFKAAPVFSALTRHLDRPRQRRIAIRATVLAGAILFFFGLFGDDVLRILGISLSGVRVGGGILLLLVSIQLVAGHEPGPGPAAADGSTDAAADIAVFPLATPMLAGPATITAIVVMASELKNDVLGNVVMLAMLVLVLVITLGCLLSAAAVQRRLGETGMSVVSRILGILLAALAADMILAGIKAADVFR
jgi:multiple antibiotic resistance protein